MNTAQIQARKA
jgi:multidrug efflux pump subunit AcrA (membrane-fusion protein)